MALKIQFPVNFKFDPFSKRFIIYGKDNKDIFYFEKDYREVDRIKVMNEMGKFIVEMLNKNRDVESDSGLPQANALTQTKEEIKSESVVDKIVNVVKRGRGRPRKIQLPVTV